VIKFTYKLGKQSERRGLAQLYLQVSEVSLTDFLSTKANPCQGYSCKSTQSSHKCSSNK